MFRMITIDSVGVSVHLYVKVSAQLPLYVVSVACVALARHTWCQICPCGEKHKCNSTFRGPSVLSALNSETTDLYQHYYCLASMAPVSVVVSTSLDKPIKPRAMG